MLCCFPFAFCLNDIPRLLSRNYPTLLPYLKIGGTAAPTAHPPHTLMIMAGVIWLSRLENFDDILSLLYSRAYEADKTRQRLIGLISSLLEAVLQNPERTIWSFNSTHGAGGKANKS